MVNLIKLQELDLKILSLDRKKSELPSSLREAEKSLENKRKVLSEVEQKLEGLSLKKKMEEDELEEEYKRLKRSQSRLMQIRGSREYQALLREIEEIKKANKQREENLLKLMEELEELKKQEESLKQELEELEKKVLEERTHFEVFCKKLEEEKANYLREREKVARNISQSLLKRYEFIRQRRGGLAVVGVENGTCEGCHMNIPPQLFNDLQRDDRYFECPLCRRLIYYKKIYFPEDVEDSTDSPPSE